MFEKEHTNGNHIDTDCCPTQLLGQGGNKESNSLFYGWEET